MQNLFRERLTIILKGHLTMKLQNLKAYSDIGGRKDQQDNYLLWQSRDKRLKCMAVLDGAGGCGHGAKASKLAKIIIESNLKKLSAEISPDNLAKCLAAIAVRAHRALLAFTEESPETEGMATTLVLGCIQDDYAHITWVGDSRAYLYRQDNLTCLTSDHSQVNEFVIRRMITHEQARVSSEKNRITRAIGASNHQPDGLTVKLEDSDEILLVTDGVIDVLSDTKIQEIMTDAKDYDKAEAIVESAVTSGTRDNTTAIWYQHDLKSTDPVNNNYQLQAARAAEIPVAPADTEQSYRIDVVDNYGNKQSCNVVDEDVVIGRSVRAGVSIPGDPYLNPNHLRIQKDGDAFIVSDLDTHNGCFLRLTGKPMKLKAPFELLIGTQRLSLSTNEKGGESDVAH